MHKKTLLALLLAADYVSASHFPSFLTLSEIVDVDQNNELQESNLV
jgi:hypothetical protein